jgi:hypothetical protein
MKNGGNARTRLAVLPMAAILGLQAALPAEAALPPQYQRMREMEAVLSHPELMSVLREEPVEMIRYVGPDLYEVHAGFCRVEARIENDPAFNPEPGWAGPRAFIVVLGDVTCE